MIKDILVQLTGSEEDDVRLSFAEAIAVQFDARLLGVHLHTLPEVLDVTEPTRSAYIQTLLEESNADAATAFRKLEETFAKLGHSAELRQLHGMAPSVAVDLARMAREVDLFVGTRPYGDPQAQYRIEESVLFGSGRGCLFLPPGGTPGRSFNNILVAWDGSREAARALDEAMPFLVRAENVFVGQIVDPNQTEGDAERSFSGISAHLARYGVDTERSHVAFRSHTGEQVHEMAHQRGADLIVSGAYGHGRFIEWVFGGATRYLLRNATLPVLMAH
jgi:nucleotide-binding universal stress UspA family protein